MYRSAEVTAVAAALGNATSIISPRVSVLVHQKGLSGDEESAGVFPPKECAFLAAVVAGRGNDKGLT